MTRVVAALYVAAGGAYVEQPGIDAWPAERDARTYAGPAPVVAHPPCERWGNYWSGGPSATVRRRLGDDGGCFAAALASVRQWGGGYLSIRPARVRGQRTGSRTRRRLVGGSPLTRSAA